MTEYVWLVRVDDSEPDVWYSEDSAMHAAVDTVDGLADAEDRSFFYEDTGVAYEDAPDQQLVGWWNDNREPKVLVTKHRVLGLK